MSSQVGEYDQVHCEWNQWWALQSASTPSSCASSYLDGVQAHWITWVWCVRAWCSQGCMCRHPCTANLPFICSGKTWVCCSARHVEWAVCFLQYVCWCACFPGSSDMDRSCFAGHWQINWRWPDKQIRFHLFRVCHRNPDSCSKPTPRFGHWGNEAEPRLQSP